MSGFDANTDEEERNHWNDVMRTFLHYENFVEIDLERRQNHLNRLPKALADKLPDISYEKLTALHNASKVNQVYFKEMVYWHARQTVFDEKGNSVLPKKEGPRIHPNQQHRNLAVLHSLYREWSSEGAAERAIPFNALINELKTHLPVTKENAYKQRVLVPGCGIGRLPVEIASHGYATEGNEFSA
jgi:carnosine N-methyltransferase